MCFSFQYKYSIFVGKKIESHFFIFLSEKNACEKINLDCTHTAGCKEKGNARPSCYCEEGYQLSANGTKCIGKFMCVRLLGMGISLEGVHT